MQELLRGLLDLGIDFKKIAEHSERLQSRRAIALDSRKQPLHRFRGVAAVLQNVVERFARVDYTIVGGRVLHESR